MPPKRKNILITGASSGLGEGMARAFAAKGCNLALCARRVERLIQLQSELLAAYPQSQVFVRELDVCNHDQVFEVFGAFRQQLGTLDRIVVNAGTGGGSAIGKGDFAANRQIAETNFIAAMAQSEAAMEIFYQQNAGHLVLVSSVSAMRGFGSSLNLYAASKAAVATLAEGLQLDTRRTPIKVTALLPGYILTDINRDVKNAPFRVDLETGVRALVSAIEKEKRRAFVPSWPWTPLSYVMKAIPFSLWSRMS